MNQRRKLLKMQRFSWDLETAAKKIPFDEEQARKVIAGVVVTATATPTLISPAQALRDSMGRDLEILEELVKLAAKVPRAVIGVSWEILKRNVIATAKLFGLTPVEGEESEHKQAVDFLTFNVLGSQNVMVAVYALAAALQKVEENLEAEISAKDADDFVRACMAIITVLSVEVDRKIVESKPRSSSS